MDKDENYQTSFGALDYSLNHQDQILMMKSTTQQEEEHNNINSTTGMVDYMLHNPQQHQQYCCSSSSNSFDKLSFADVMQFADFGPKLSLNQTKIPEEETGIIDPVYFLKFPVLNDRIEDQSLVMAQDQSFREVVMSEEGGDHGDEEGSVQLRFLENKSGCGLPESVNNNSKNKRKRPRSVKTTEEVESQRMTHIAVERNRRKQMNEHLRVLRSLMPSSYVQRGDQASIIGGAIEFVRELEQLLQCLESQKRRRLLGEGPGAGGRDPTIQQQSLSPQQPYPPQQHPGTYDQMKMLEFESSVREETAENKSCLADVEVKVLGFDAMIKILSRRRPGQLIKTIAALEDLQLSILHTNITTIEQTVLYSFNVKVGSESRYTAEDIASSVQQIFSFIHANSNTNSI